MKAEIKTIAAKRVACLAHKGDYSKIGAKFGELMRWVGQEGVPFTEMLALYYDDPHSIQVDELRSDAAVTIPPDYMPNDPRIQVKEVPAGEYAASIHYGPYSTLPQAWVEFYTTAIPALGRSTSASLCFELYLNDCLRWRRKMCKPSFTLLWYETRSFLLNRFCIRRGQEVLHSLWVS